MGWLRGNTGSAAIIPRQWRGRTMKLEPAAKTSSVDHDHAVCRLCGAIFDVDRDQLQLPTPPGYLTNGLMVTGIRFEYEVICRACQEAPGRVR